LFILDVSARLIRAGVDREALMSQESVALTSAIFASESPAPSLTPHQIMPLLIGATVGEIERELVLQTLARCEGNRTRAARMLGLSIRTLRNKIRLYAADGIDVPAHTDQHPGGLDYLRPVRP
jgi:DNA-binding NtrC family response regulator